MHPPSLQNAENHGCNSVIFITWDESDFTGTGLEGFGDDTGCCDSTPDAGGGHVLTVVISHSDHPAPRTWPTTTSRCWQQSRMA